MANSAGHDIGAGLRVRPAALSISVTAAGSGDTTSAVGYSVDTSPATLGARYNSAVLCVASLATMASGKSIAVTALIEDSANDSDWATLVTSQVVYTHTASGAAATAAHKGGVVSVDLSKADRYIRATLNPDMSATGTDTAIVSSVWAIGNPDRIPYAS